MSVNPYIGHPSQLCGVEEVCLIGGKGDGMRLLQVHNGAGLFFTVAADRCADVYRLNFKGDNMGYFAPCGYVAPAYYQEQSFLKSFTAGFFTTCGLNNVGSAKVDGNEVLPMHGTIGNTPCERIWWTETDEAIEIHAEMNDSRMFGAKLMLHRVISCGKYENWMKIADTVENQGDTEAPLLLMYHMNMGYPLLSEHAQVEIASKDIIPSNQYAAEDIENWRTVLPPGMQAKERCYRHLFEEEGGASIYNPQINKGLEISFDGRDFPCMIQWKMFRYRDYALGLEPRNCVNADRASARENGELLLLQPGESKAYEVNLRFFEK